MPKASKSTKYVSKVPGVYFREDGKPRWVVRFRKDGKEYRPPASFPVDLSVQDSTNVLHVVRARLDAEAMATKERVNLRAHGKSHEHMATSWTLGSVLEKTVKEIEDGEHSHIASIRTIKSNLTVLLGKTKTGKNTKGFEVLMQKPLHKLAYEDFHGNKEHSLSQRLKSRTGEPAPLGSVKKMLRAVQFAFKRAEAWGIEFENPIAQLKKMKVKDERDRVLSAKEWDSIIRELDDVSLATKSAIQFARFTAVRRSEAIKLDWPDIDFDHKTARLRGTKSPDGSYNERTIPLPKEAMEIVKALWENTKNPKGAVFAHQHANQWKRIAIDTTTQAWTRARARVAKKTHDTSILTARTHDLRHTRITEIGQILTTAEAARVSGHKDLRTFMRYFNPDAKSIGAKLDAYESNRAVLGSVEEAVKALMALSANDMVLAFQMALSQSNAK